ncbi:hypothetical protein CBR_g5668 [Chara braunii]|uniref:Condensin complex subunit 1 C-terminal domain-containing protein n=1 Tax=Chara braunii TaxID=69332 RepID=A0A388JRQ8_CHABU|nr:hypothetical protein CBR_g5668 [Chara braunii]|eukprot:GBG60494.1 hypothetical protein CBR_g5668 [Chara braunii]
MKSNQRHIILHEARDNVRPQAPTTVTRAFGEFAFSKIVRLLSDPNLVIRRKAVTAAVEMLSTAESRVHCLEAGMADELVKLFDDEDDFVREHAALTFMHTAGSEAGCQRLIKIRALRGLVNMIPLSSPFDDAGVEVCCEEEVWHR